ncbi:MAG: hypothetical protein CSA39_01645 [Flavobacteriales bacterium]|nr:MAG: hypothetical protein CSA39_01645 [Flavobacteriales bacterium]
MKKIIVLSICLFIALTSCSREDDEVRETPLSKSLIGTWNLDYYVQNGVLTEEIICDELVEYVFLNNGTYTQTTFSGDGTTDCLTAVQINGMWQDLGNNNYELTPNGGGSSALNITFQDDFTKFVTQVNTNRTEVYAKRR